MICAFRKKSQLPLDDCLDALAEHIPVLTRSSLHRCLQRHGLSRLPSAEEQTGEKKKFKDYPIGYMHVDITEIQVGKTKLYVFVGICRVTKFAHLEVYERQTAENACDFLNKLVTACPFKIHTILTDNGSQFTYTKNILKRGKGPAKRHVFDLLCKQHGVRHKRTAPYTPQTNGQVERFNRTLKEATTQAFQYESPAQIIAHLKSFVLAYNTAKRLSAIKRRTPWQAVNDWWKSEPKRFNTNPHHQLTGLYT